MKNSSSKEARRHQAARLVVAFISILAIVATNQEPAFADCFGQNIPPECGPLANDASHSFCYTSAFDQNLRDNAGGRMANLDNQTQMTDLFVTFGCSYSNEIDVFWADANLPGTARGQYVCGTTVIGTTCGHGTITLDPAQINIGANDEWDTSKTACHELGHSVGLGSHSSTDCMVSGEIPAAINQWIIYNSHHVSHINAQY